MHLLSTDILPTTSWGKERQPLLILQMINLKSQRKEQPGMVPNQVVGVSILQELKGKKTTTDGYMPGGALGPPLS